MLHLHHFFPNPDSSSVFAQHELRAKRFIAIRMTHDGGRHDDAVERAVTRKGSEFSIVQVVLGGSHIVRHGAYEGALDPGDVFVSKDMRAGLLRSLTTHSDLLTLGWHASKAPAMRDAYGSFRLTSADHARAVRLGEEMATSDTPAAIARLRDVFAMLRAYGVPTADVPTTQEPTAAHRFANALERTVFPLSARPMAVDLARELGVSERHALRQANTFFETYYASGSTWREYIHAMRVGLGPFFMSHPRARTESVSRLLGFSSPTSFCHALHQAGLPSPTAIQQELLR